jgi:Domain of unknown function (DUF4411)
LRYSIDTSALLDCWVRHYPPDVFPTVWVRMKELVNKDILIATEEVLFELKKVDDDVYRWAKKHPSMFVLVDEEIQRAVASILQLYPRLVDTRKNRSRADPFVVALAQIKGCTVVTGEALTGKIEKPNIPDVCMALGIRYIKPLDMFREQGLQL